MRLTARMALEVASHEAIIRQTYKDSVGVSTWSVGLTNGSGHDVTRYVGKPQSLEYCLEVYVWALQKYLDTVLIEFKGHDLTEAQVAAALSFHWNTGKIHKASWPDLWKSGKIEEARDSFMSWIKPKEIKERREKEAELFFDGKWSNNGKMGEYTRLTARGTPVWKSRVEIDVADILNRMIEQPRPLPLVLDQIMKVIQDQGAVAPKEALRRVRAILEQVP